MSNAGKFVIVDLDIYKDCGEFRYYGMNDGAEFIDSYFDAFSSREDAIKYMKNMKLSHSDLNHHEFVVRRICSSKKKTKNNSVVDSWTGYILAKDIDGAKPIYLGKNNCYANVLSKIIPFDTDFDAAYFRTKSFLFAFTIYKIEVKSATTLVKVNNIII